MSGRSSTTKKNRTLYARSSEDPSLIITYALRMSIADITSQRKGMVMGEFGYFYGYSMVFVFFVGGLVGFVIGRWFT